MLYSDLKSFIDDLERNGELLRIRDEADPYLEIACITDKVSKFAPEQNKALLFEKVKGSTMPVLTNAFGSAKRMNMVAGTDDYSEMTDKLSDFLELLQEPRKTIIDKLGALPLLRDVARCFPKYVKRGSCQDQVMLGEAINLDEIPILTTWPEDGGPFVTLPLVFTKDPIDGKRNCGMYRLQKYDKKTTGFHVHTHHTGADHIRKAKKLGKDRIEVAVAIGAEPAVTFSAVVPLPPGLDEMIFAGFINEAPVKMVKCKTIDMEVPASAEIVLEGYVLVDEKRWEGPFGDHTGFYSLADDYWVFHVTAITTRAQPVYNATVVGPPPQEDHHMTDAIERLFLPLMQQPIPEVIDYRLPYEGVAHNLMMTQIHKDYPGQGRKLAHAVWGLGQAMFTKLIVVGDDTTPGITDYLTFTKYIAKHLDVNHDLHFVVGPTETLDHASRALHYGSKASIDMTRHMPGEPERAEVPEPSDTPDDDEMLKKLQSKVPDVVALSTPFKGSDRFVTFVALDKSKGANAREVIAAMWKSFPNLACAERVIVFDAKEDLANLSRLTWIGLSHIDPERDIHFDLSLEKVDGLKHEVRHPRRLGVDCTSKNEADGFEREWPTEQVFPDEVIKRCDEMLARAQTT